MENMSTSRAARERRFEIVSDSLERKCAELAEWERIEKARTGASSKAAARGQRFEVLREIAILKDVSLRHNTDARGPAIEVRGLPI